MKKGTSSTISWAAGREHDWSRSSMLPMLLYLQEIIEQSEFSHYVEQEVCQILCCCETKVLARYSQKSLSIEDSYGMKALYVWCSKFWFAVIKHSSIYNRTSHVWTTVSLTPKIINKNHQLAGGFFRTHRAGTRRGKKKCLFRSKGTGSLARAWRCIVDISEGCCQPDWKKGFFESTSLGQGFSENIT